MRHRGVPTGITVCMTRESLQASGGVNGLMVIMMCGLRILSLHSFTFCLKTKLLELELKEPIVKCFSFFQSQFAVNLV